MQGTIVIEGAKIFVRYESTRFSAPIRDVMMWRVERIEYRGESPMNGDALTSTEPGRWAGHRYSVEFDRQKSADRFESFEVPCPPARGKRTRWNDGRWEKLLAKGWVAA